MKNYLECTIPQHVLKVMQSRDYLWDDFSTEALIKTALDTGAIFLSRHKSKDAPSALVFRDMEDKFHFAAYVQFHKQEEEGSDEGSWTLNYTFDENGIDTKNWNIFTFPTDQEAKHLLEDIAFSQYGIIFKYMEKDSMGKICKGSSTELVTVVLDALYDYMRANVTLDPVLQMDNYFTMTAEAVNDGSVYVGIEPSAILKQYVKDDVKTDVIDTNKVPARV